MDEARDRTRLSPSSFFEAGDFFVQRLNETMKFMERLSFFLMCIVLGCSSFAFAGELSKDKADQSLMLEEMTVLARPIDENEPIPTSSHVTIISGEDLEERFSSVSEVLSETAGVTVNRFGGLGDFSAITIRGSSSEQVLIYLDGFLLNNAQGGGIDLSLVPLSQLASMEIYRGSAPLLFGQSGIGGIVHLKTKAATRDRAYSYQLQYGSFSTARLNATASHKPGRSDYLIGLNYEKSNNDFEFLNGNGTQFNPLDDKLVKRKNSQFESLNLITKLGFDFSDKGRVSLYHNFLKTDKGVPGLGAFQSEEANFKTESHRSSLRFDIGDLLKSKLNLKLGLHYASKKEVFQDRLGKIGLANQDNENKTEVYETALNMDRTFGENQTLQSVLKYRQERFKPFDRLKSSQVSTSERETVSLALEDRIRLFKNRLTLTPGFLYDVIKNRFQGDTFLTSIGQPTPTQSDDRFLSRQIGLYYTLTDHLVLRANIGRYFRAPNFFELFGDRGGTIGNDDLIPEKALNRDVGLEYQRQFSGVIRQINFHAAYFNNVVDQVILFIQTSQKTSRADNIGQAQTIGQEFSTRVEMGAHLKFDANYTHQRAINLSKIPSQKGKILPGRPVHEGTAKVELYSAFYALFYSYHFTSENFLDRVNQREASARQLHNVGFTTRPFDAWSLTFEAKNLSDNQIQDVFGFPLPGRSYFITLQGVI